MVHLTFAGAALIAVTYGLARFALGLFVPEFRAAFDVSATAIGWVMAGSFGGYLGALALAGLAVTRWGARKVAVTAGVFATTALLGVAVAPGAVLLGVAATVGGASTGLASPALAGAVEQHLEAPRRPAAQTAINAGTSVGLMVAAPTALLAAAAWRAAWLGFAVLAVAATLVAARAVPPRPPAHAVEVSSPLRIDRRLAATALLLGLSSAVFWGFGRELLEANGLNSTVSRSAWVAVGAGGLLGGFAGSLAAHRGLRAALAISWGTFVAAHAGLATAPATAAAAFGLTAAFGTGYMALTGLLIVWSVADRPQPGKAVAAVFLLLAVGQIVGSPVAGLTVDLVGYPAAFGSAAVVAAAGLAALPGRRPHDAARTDEPFDRLVGRDSAARSRPPATGRAHPTRPAHGDVTGR